MAEWVVQGVTFACINAAMTGDAAPAKKEEESKDGEAPVELSTFAFRCASLVIHQDSLTRVVIVYRGCVPFFIATKVGRNVSENHAQFWTVALPCQQRTCCSATLQPSLGRSMGCGHLIWLVIEAGSFQAWLAVAHGQSLTRRGAQPQGEGAWETG